MPQSGPDKQRSLAIPALVGSGIGLLLYTIYGWWGFFVVFPGIGLAIPVGIHREIAVMEVIAAGGDIRDTECIYCGTCRDRCPVEAIR